jgi:hypothetical protein
MSASSWSLSKGVLRFTVKGALGMEYRSLKRLLGGDLGEGSFTGESEKLGF